MPKLFWYQYLSVMFIIASLILFGLATNIEIVVPEPAYQRGLLSVPAIPVNVASGAGVFTDLNQDIPELASVSAQAVYVSDFDSGSVLWQKNANQDLYPASTTKIMTALVARQVYQLDQVLMVPPEIKNQGNGMGLKKGEQVLVRDLLAGLLIPSGNDAAYVLATQYAGGYETYVNLMNEKALVLGLEHTTFANPSGLDDFRQLTTARDLAILARELLKDQFLSELVSTKEKTVTDVSGKNNHLLVNTNQLLGVDQTILGVKTGTTPHAGEVLVTLVDRNGHKILIALMASRDRYQDTKIIIDWIYSNYQWFSFDEVEEHYLQDTK
ncbi:MAG: D-alanyl-D-alanine carboxypeptidase family protein [Patescibacteria group bacterium]